MLTSFFKKSTVVNYIFIISLFLICYFLQLNNTILVKSTYSIFNSDFTRIILLLSSFFLVNFIVKRNGLTKNSSFSILFFLLYLLLFPSVFNNPKTIFANFFLLLAYRRIISLQTLKAPKEKIFDASIWIFVASLFQFWCIIFIVLVYISILFHASRDYRNWLLPFIAFFVTSLLFIICSLIFNENWINQIMNQIQLDFNFNFLTSNLNSISGWIFMVFGSYFLLAMVFSLTNKPLVLQASYKKMIFGFVFSVLIFLFNIEKNNDLILFSYFPLSVLSTNAIEYSNNNWYKEIILWMVLILCFGTFIYQL